MRATRLDAIVLAVVFLGGVAHLRSAFTGDQYLYLIGAQKIAHHGVMYREFWDLKQPLIYYLYAAAGLSFGFTAPGIHAFETLYQTAFAIVLIAVGSVCLRGRWVASIVPLLTIGAYYAFAANDVLTSVEAFAGLPLFITAVSAADAFATARGAAGKGVIAGCAGAFAVLAKVAFAPIVLALWLAPALMRLRPREAGVTLRGMGGIAAGFILVIGLAAAYFASAGVLDVALRTAFVDPPAILARLPSASRTPLLAFTKGYVRVMWPVLVLAVAGVVTLRGRRDPFALQMIVWTIVGAAVVAAQSWSYEYKFYVLVVPTGMLAAYGVEALTAYARAHPGAPRVALAALLAVALLSSVYSGVQLQRRWHNFAQADRTRFAPGIAFLARPDARPGPILVFGNAEVYADAHRDQAVAINGWSPELLLPQQWSELARELAAAPPAYIMIEHDGIPPAEESVLRSPDVSALMMTRYRIAFVTPDTTWYERRN